MPTAEEIRAYAREIAEYLTSPETVIRLRPLSGAWDGCTMLAEQGSGWSFPRLEIAGLGGVTLPAWGSGFEERAESLLVFALEVLKLGPPIYDLQRLEDQVNNAAADKHDLLCILREVTRYWRSFLAVEHNKVSEHDLLTAARGDLSEDDYKALLPQHQEAVRLKAAGLLLLDSSTLAEDLVEATADALEDGR